MSWPGEDWTVGLTGHVLQKVKQLQAQNEKLTKERQQRQLQLDNSEAALHKQKRKHEEVRVELAAVQRELGGVREAAQAEVRVRERLAHELQVKTGQVHSLEGQLESSKNSIQNLAQEIKRLEAELEKLEKGNGSGDSMLFSTPCWNMSSPWDHSGGFRAEGDGKAQHVRQQLQFGDIPKPVVGGASFAFPQQPQKSPPIRHHARQSEASTPSSMFPWERDDLWSTPKGRPAPCVSSGDVIKSNDSGIEEALRNEIDGLRVRVSELQREALLESERLKDVDSRLAQAQRDINTKEQSLTRTQDQLTRAQTCITQETDRVQAVEQKVKQLQEELKCQRQNAESSRCNAEQRRKDMEREHQKELLEQQRERQALEKQHQQEMNRLNQEIQQARTLHNTLQAQHDKVCLQKQGLERDLEDVKGKLKNTEADLKESQKRETQTEAKLTEALRENENLTVSLGQVKKQEKALQEEVKRLTDELAEALKLIKELQAQLAAPPQPVSVPHFGSTGDCFSPSVSFHHDRSPPHQHSAQRKRAPQTGRTREEERMKYPSGREPGEGIDSEHIGNLGSEESQRFRAKCVDTQQSCSLKCSDTDVDISLTEQDTGIEDVDTDSFMSDSTLSTRSKSESGITRNLQDVTHDTTGNVGKCDSASLKDLKKENSELRDELRDVNYELQKRLDDLESQRRAEAEARTKLKQLSRKHSTQTEQQRAKALELKDSMAKLEAQLEQEKKEITKLRENLDVLEREAEKRQEEKEREQDESAELKEVLAEMERKETSVEEEMERMRKELEDLQRKLEQEREEREQEREEERKKIRKEEAEGLKIARLQEELDNLRRFGQLEDEISKENFPVAYLQLDHHLNTSNKDSPESICDSVNLHNTMICQETRAVELIMALGAQTNPGTTTEGKTEMEEPLAVSLDDTTILVLEIERLRVERDQEAENAKLAQGKLEDLQKQVNTQTKHLTHAFESQSKNIENLLRELHNKECALQRQAEELQKCQEKITLLEEAQHNREDVVFGEVSMHPEPSTEISRELSCDSVISNMSISDQEMFNDDTQQILKDSSLQLPVEHSVSRNVEQTNTKDASDKLQIATEAFSPHELNCECPPSSSVNSEGVFTKNAQETENSSVTSSRSQDEQVQNVSEDSTKDDSGSERVTKELQEAENQLNVLKTQNETLGLVNEELLSVKRENEELKAKLRWLEKDTCADRTSKEDQNNEKLNEEGFLDGAASGREESVVPDENSEDKGMEGMKETAEVHALHKRIQTLQDQIQNLSEQNRTHAEELNLWKISAMGETADSSSPSITLREFQIFLPCNSIKPCTQQTRTTDMTHQCGSEDGNEQTNLPETQMTHAGSKSQGPAEGLMTENETMITKNTQECATSSFTRRDETPPVCTSHTTTSNNKDGLSDLQQIALMSSVSHGNTTGAVANSQEDALINISISSEYQTKVISTKPIAVESREIHDSQNSVLRTARNQIETKETVALDKHGYRHGDATDKQNNRHVAEVGSASQTNESSMGQRAESDEVNGDGNRTEVREVQSVSTQTEESGELSDTTVKRSLVHTGTQTDNVPLETDEDEGHEGPADSPPLSRTLQSVTNQLLLSKAFPMSDPAHLAERIRQNRNRMSAAYDDTEYEPYGLPEVVMKGFADIPSGPACPYVLRRGLLGTDAMPLPLKEATPQDEDEDIEP
ncbi:centromere protein F [Triplophysa rosa]|uniref:Centromere protein F-like n=1 Tax=Triplophysa rosa TaxID=992332 RepID=A0A9W7TLP6_TRIRA|nr:centromere protein F [Triplophysa rosa]XP_057205373.1 centromere protein F [Triplophysa rosa]KAI7801238.1 putative centromere protein F-like [Triplophysa rosa]